MAQILIDILKKIILFLKRFFVNTEDINYNADAYEIGMKSQTTMVLEHLEEYGSITSKEAYDKYGIQRLSSIIYLLRKNGVIIATEKIAQYQFVFQYMGKE